MKTMLDKCAVAGDITQAIDRRGAWSCAITVIGGTESTAVKLQSCETADGTFEDFKTLIPSADASASQYKGFVVDLSGAGNFIKVTGATMATCVLGDCDADVKKVAIKTGEIPSGADLEDNKTATINVSTYIEPVEIEPTAGKDGMKKATVTLSNIPSGGGSWQTKIGELDFTCVMVRAVFTDDIYAYGCLGATFEDDGLVRTLFFAMGKEYDAPIEASTRKNYENFTATEVMDWLAQTYNTNFSTSEVADHLEVYL